MKKNMRRVSLRVTAQTLYNLERLRQMGELKSLGRVVDKLVREKMISLHKDHVNAVKPGAPLTQEELNTMHFDRVWIFYPPQYEGDQGSYRPRINVPAVPGKHFYAAVRGTLDNVGQREIQTLAAEIARRLEGAG